MSSNFGNHPFSNNDCYSSFVKLRNATGWVNRFFFFWKL